MLQTNADDVTILLIYRCFWLFSYGTSWLHNGSIWWWVYIVTSYQGRRWLYHREKFLWFYVHVLILLYTVHTAWYDLLIHHYFFTRLRQKSNFLQHLKFNKIRLRLHGFKKTTGDNLFWPWYVRVQERQHDNHISFPHLPLNVTNSPQVTSC